MRLDDVKKELCVLRDAVNHHDWRYYVLSDPEISDKEYDDLYKKLQTLESRYPQFITADSPTQRVSGQVLDKLNSVGHKKVMLSLDNTYSIDELYDWEVKIKKMLKISAPLDYFAELKIDGVSCSLRYEKGVFVLGATRGDGRRGEDITLNLKAVKSIPLKLRGRRLPEELEVRGEIYLPKGEFEAINRQRRKNNEPPFANPRNAASGSLKLLDSALSAQRKLSCFVHSFGSISGLIFDTQKSMFDKLYAWGLRINPCGKLCRGLEEVVEYCRLWQDKRDSLDYEVDGVVVKVNGFSLQERLGQTLKSPRWAVAYKFAAHQATTRIDDITVQVGRSGILTPVAVLEPVECGGVTIARSTLHNFDEIKRLDIRLGDAVLVQRSGDVIPKIIKVITSRRKGSEKKIRVPARCPVCGSVCAKEKEDDVYLYCLNFDCPAQIKGRLLHFASRRAMDIEGMGDSLVDALVENGRVKSLTDIYGLRQEDLLMLPLFKEKKSDNVIRAIAESRQRGLSRLIYALGIKHVGEKAALTLARRFRDMNNFFELDREDLESIPEIGPVMAQSIVSFFSAAETRSIIKHLAAAGVNLIEKNVIRESGPLSGKRFIFTGTLSGLSRAQAQKMVEDRGGVVSSGLSKNIDFVVAGDNPGSKYAKAKKIGVKIINQSEFRRILGL